jgi:NAD(P)-dependent dehydrogenase (short-subunit alcohol dehydrogenase family)
MRHAGRPSRRRCAKADFIDVDLGSSDSARELARQATELGGGHVDILVNDAAIFPMVPTTSMAQDDVDPAFAINVKVPTKAWAAEFGPGWVRVNAVNPEPTRTEGTAVLGEAIDQSAARLQPGGRLHRTRSPQRSPTWLPTTPASSTARSSPSTAAAQRPDEHRDRGQRPNAFRRRDRQAAAVRKVSLRPPDTK